MRHVPIGEVVSEPDVWNPRESASVRPFQYIDISSVDSSEKRIANSVAVVPSEAPSRARQLVRSGDVLVSTVRPNLNAVAVVPEELDGATASTGFAVLRPDPARIEAGFLYHWVRTAVFVRAMTARATGASYPAVTERIVRESTLPLPPLPAQRRIAAVLDKADAIRRKRRESLLLLDEFLRSGFLELFGDPVRNEKGWEVVRLGDRLSFVTSGSRGWAKYYADSGRPFLRIQNVGRNELKLEDLAHVNPPLGAEAHRTTVCAGDVLLSITADLGRTAVVSRALTGGHINQHLALLRLKDLEPLYVAQFLASAGGRRQFDHLNRQAVKAGLNFDDIRSLKVLSPPKELQGRFAALFRGRQKAYAVAREAIDEADRLFDSLAQRAFRGEL